MATISAFSSFFCNSRPKSPDSSSSSSSSSTLPILRLRSHGGGAGSYPRLSATKLSSTTKAIRALAEEETLISGGGAETSTDVEEQAGGEASTTIDQTVSVPVSPSDMLTMFFQAEGSMSDADLLKVRKVLEETDGITDLKVQVLEGIASVELTKQTTVQATGVASGLVEAIQGSGFKLQTLNLSFQDEEDIN